MQRTEQTEKPAALIVNDAVAGKMWLTVSANAQRVESEDGSVRWVADMHAFSVPVGELDLDEVRAHPEHFLDYATNAQRKQAVERVQVWRDEMMAAKTRIACPLGFDVDYKPDALSDALALIQMVVLDVDGEVSWTDSDDVRHENLTLDELKIIAGTLGGYKISVQKAADAARKTIKESTTQTAITEALNAIGIS